MTAYRDPLEAARARADALEAELERAQRDLADRDARLERLRRVMDGRSPLEGAPSARRRAWIAAFTTVGLGALVVLGVQAYRVRLGSVEAAALAAPPHAPAATRPERPPMTIAIALDSRPDMASSFAQATSAIATLVGSMRDDDRVGLVQVGGGISRVVLPVSTVGSVRATLPALLRDLRPGPGDRWPHGTTSAAIDAGTSLLKRTEGDARVLVVTNGTDASWGLAESTAAYAAGQGLRVSAFGAGRFVDGYPQSIARAGHGHFADLNAGPEALARFVADELGTSAAR